MQRYAEGCEGVQKSKPTGLANSNYKDVSNLISETAPLITYPRDWVLIPVFRDIVRLALASRKDCLNR